MKSSALIFGYNDYGEQVAKNVIYKYKNITFFKREGDDESKNLKDFDTKIFDLSDEWDDIEHEYDIASSVAFCVLEDDAENIFLTISLRAQFADLTIIALSSNKESANKLKMAGANKVIPIVQTTAGIISDMLDKPIVTEVLHNILYENSDLKVAQVEIEDYQCFNGHYPSDVEWSKDHGIIVLSVIHKNGQSEFIYSAKEKHHHIENGDVFIVVGYTQDIEDFKKLIGGERCQ
jgi:Trk K+ transport system NAD-binding subunit